MKLPLQLVASMLVASACGSVWPYHGARALLGPPAYFHLGVPGENPSSMKSAEGAPSVIAAPTSGPAIIEGPVATPLTIVAESPDCASKGGKVVAASVAQSSVLIKGASAGPVTLLAPSDARVSVIGSPDGAPSNAGGSIVTGEAVAGAGGSVLIAEERGTKVSGDATACSSAGSVSATAVIGPSVGPVVVAGPTALPATIAAPAASVATAEATDAPATVAALVTEPTAVAESAISTTTPSSASERTIAAVATAKSDAALSSATASSVVASASAGAGLAGAVAEPGKISSPVRGTVVVKGADVGTTIVESSASSTASVSWDSKSSAFASAKVDLIEPVPVLAVGAAPVSNVVLSAPVAPYATIISGPSGSISAIGTPGLLVGKPTSALLRKW